MADYGFRISRTGVDVKTGDDKDMVVTSKYQMLKGVISGSGSKSLSSGSRDTVTVNHNLGYVPLIQVYIKLPSTVTLLPTDKYIELPQPYVGTAVEEDAYYHYTTTNTLTLDLYFWNDGGDSITVNYKYFIFLDKGDL